MQKEWKMTDKSTKDIKDLLDLLTQDGVQTIAPCLGGRAHFETRDIGPKDHFREGPDWMYRGKPEYVKDAYKRTKIAFGEQNEEIIVFECVRRCLMSNAPPKEGEPYLNQASVEHLLGIFAHEYVNKSL